MPGGRRQGRGRAKRPSRSERHQRARAAGVNAAVARAEGAIEIQLPARRVPPETVVAHLGPTNSGKTYHALEVLKERGRGVYAGPLRMLAQEAHRRLSAELGEEAVGLVTGEERINDSAPIICCTVEMAPSSGEVLVLDEVQWADDPERGSAWTRLLLAGDYRHILVLGALDAEPLVLNAFPDAEVKVFERILPLEFVGERSLRGLTPGTVVVAFSRKAVLALAGEINRLHPDRVSVLYGAMPLSSRREEIDRFLSGRSDVTVATDVLGHGVNLPCETLLFAETTKFDGESRRDLLPWELAQIAGRAGRFGLVERGHVGVLTGIPWASADPEIVEEALQPHVVLPVRAPRLPHRRRGADPAAARRSRRRRPSPPRCCAGCLAPRRHACLGARGLARRRVAEPDPGPARGDSAPTGRPQPPTLDRGHLEAHQCAGRRGQRRAALDPGARARGRHGAALAPHFLLDPARLRDSTLEEAEQAGRTASILRWFALQYPGVGGVTIERAAELEEAAAARVVARLRLEVNPPRSVVAAAAARRRRRGSRSATAASAAAEIDAPYWRP